MGDKAIVQLLGSKKLKRKLEKLTKKVQGQVLRPELRAATKEVANAIKARIPVGKTKRLKGSLKVRAAKRKRGRIGFIATMGKGDFQGETFYGAFVNLGFRLGKRKATAGAARTGEHGRHRENGDSRRFIPGLDFMREGFMSVAPRLSAELPRRILARIKTVAKGG